MFQNINKIENKRKKKFFIEKVNLFIKLIRVFAERNNLVDNSCDSSSDRNNQNKYVVLIDPLDGSSNIDVNVSVGTIFSIYRRKTKIGTEVSIDDFLQKGRNQVAAGYIIYGTSTMLVYTTGSGVNGFTLNPAIGTFYHSNSSIKIPNDGNIYSINEGNYLQFPEFVKKYIKFCQEEKDDRPYTSRYIGSLVSDFHRNMIKGGIFLYPQTSKNPNGQLED